MDNSKSNKENNWVNNQADNIDLEEAKKQKRKKRLKGIFNAAASIGASVATMLAVKTAVTATATWACAPAAVSLVLTSCAIGLAAGGLSHYRQKRKAKKEGLDIPKFWSQENKKTMTKSSLWALVGGAAFLGFDGVMDKCFGTAAPEALPIPEEIAIEPTAELVNIEPQSGDTAIIIEEPTIEEAVIIPDTPLQSLELLIDNGANVSDKVISTMELAKSGDAQAIKDLAFFLFNGFENMPKDQTLALELFNQAADLGNIQAQVDLSYIEYHGLAGVNPDPETALDDMEELTDKSAKAQWFIDQWTGVSAEPIVEDVATEGIIIEDVASIEQEYIEPFPEGDDIDNDPENESYVGELAASCEIIEDEGLDPELYEYDGSVSEDDFKTEYHAYCDTFKEVAEPGDYVEMTIEMDSQKFDTTVTLESGLKDTSAWVKEYVVPDTLYDTAKIIDNGVPAKFVR